MPNADQLDALHSRIRSCTRCIEEGYLAEAHPVVWGKPGQRGMIVGQAPGPNAHLADAPWSGVSGRTLRGWLEIAGFDPDRFERDWCCTSITRCFPGKATSGNGDCAPSAAERALCRPHLDDEIDLMRPRLVVTLGRMAADALIPGARKRSLGDLVGSIATVDLANGSGYGPVPVVPLPHPSGVGRWLNDPANRALVHRAMTRLHGHPVLAGSWPAARTAARTERSG